ncbi:MAG: D-alanine--D-alanine ligase [Proteobacteria bacterium]|nr:D-alanine--D-alanine ligase [Pseudomonadota bacterium]
MDKGRMKKRKIGVLLGGKSSEREISIKSGNAILQSLLRSGYHAIGIDVNNDLTERLKRKGIEVAFIALHGKWGEDGTVQGLLEIMGIPYTGSGVLGSSLSMDKAIMKLLFTGMGIPTPAYTILADERELTFPIPFVVKPANEGSTIGTSIVRKEKEKDDAIKTALKYDRKLLIERYIKGREITVGIVNNIVLPIIEVRPSKGFYDFEAKYTKGMTEYIVPAKINKKIERRAKDIALGVYKAFELSGCVRIDMLMEKDMPQVIDINTSPGMTETSLVPKAWGHMGKTFDELIEEILKGASLKT